MGTDSSVIQRAVEKNEEKKLPDSVKILTAHNSGDPQNSVSLTFSLLGDQDFFITADTEGVILKWCTITGKLLNVYWGHELAVFSLLRMHDFLISGSGDRSIRLWSLNSGSELRCLEKAHSGSVKCLERVSDTDFISAGTDNSVIRWSCRGELVHKIVLKEADNVQRIKNLSSDEKNLLRLLICCDNGLLYIWEGDQDSFSFRKVHQDSVQHVVVFPNAIFVSVSVDGLICVWNDSQRTVPRVLHTMNETSKDYASKVRDICVLSDSRLAVAIGNGFVIYNKKGGISASCLDGHDSWVLKLTTLNEKKLLVTAAVDGSIGIWEIDKLEKPALIKLFCAHSCSITTLSRLTESSFCSGDEKGNLFLWQNVSAVNKKRKKKVIDVLKNEAN